MQRHRRRGPGHEVRREVERKDLGGGGTYSDGALAGYRGSDNVQSTLINTLLRSLEADLDEVERMAGNDSADTTNTSGDE